MAPLARDLRYALRLLFKTPALTSVAILSLALGIGANTAIFGAINALMLRSLPLHDPQQLVTIGAIRPDASHQSNAMSLAMFHAIQKRANAFSDVFVWRGGGMSNFEVNGVRYASSLDEASGDYFHTLGVRPILGRFFTRDDAPLDGRASSQVAVISYGCWKSRYAGDPRVLGKTIRVEGVPLRIIGVAPPGLTGLYIEVQPEVTVPIGFTHHKMNLRGDRWLVFGRLKPNVSIYQARAQLQVLWPGILKSTVPGNLHGAQRAQFFAMRPDIQPFSHGFSFLRQKLDKPLELLMALVGAVLLIACVNLANLLLARASSRRHEFAVRAAIGAGRWPLMRMLLIEALLLSFAGSALGILIAGWTARFLLNSFWIGFVPLSINPSPDGHVLLFAAALAVFTGVLFGIAPAWQMSRSDPAEMLSQSARTVGGRTGRFSRALIAAQVSLSLVLLIGATLFVTTLRNLQNANLGYRSDHLLLMQLFLNPGRNTIPNRTAYYHELVSKLSQLPGVASVSYEHMGPAGGYEYKEPVSTTGTGGATIDAIDEWTGPGLFHTLGMHVLAGRGFTWRDDENSPRVAVISESLARALFRQENPIGRTIDVGSDPAHQSLKIIGVVNSASLWKLDSHQPLAVYYALMQEPKYNESKVVIRTRVRPLSIAHDAEHTLASLGYQYSLGTTSLKQRIGQILVNQRMIALLASGFSLLALLLAAVGLYGVMSYAVIRRTAEIGIRMALGAMRADVLRMVLGEVLLLVLVGIAIALPIAFACNKLISGMLFGVSATDPGIVLTSCSILLAVAAFAGFLPARRAARVDPMVALRYE